MKKLVLFEYLTYIPIVILIIIIAVWNSLINPSINIPRILPTIIYNIPLLIIMFKLKKNKFNTYIMTSFIMLLYFVVGIGNTTNNDTFVLGIIISLLSLITFISSILYVRERNRESLKYNS